MDIGMLWFDDSSNPLADKVRRAVDYYAQKYGRKATLCVINPSTLNGEADTVGGVILRQMESILPDHYWIGIDENSQEPQGQLEAA